jgi:hypothetical protein
VVASLFSIQQYLSQDFTSEVGRLGFRPCASRARRFGGALAELGGLLGSRLDVGYHWIIL